MAAGTAARPHPVCQNQPGTAVVPSGNHADAALRCRDLVAWRPATVDRLDLVAVAVRAAAARPGIWRFHPRTQPEHRRLRRVDRVCDGRTGVPLLSRALAV